MRQIETWVEIQIDTYSSGDLDRDLLGWRLIQIETDLDRDSVRSKEDGFV